MSNKSLRIPTTVGGNDKYVSVKLENSVDFFEILSLKISQKDVYGSFNSDYGVVVGRVIANGGVGIPNAKLSIFIPISDDDKLNAAISAIYPYSSPRDKDLDGVRYNLLPRVATNNPFLVAGDYSPKVPIGTFPTKEEITTNDSYLEVYEKYYKFTTVTNTSGDYMFFGVPIGIQTVHMSVDITDIGKYSMTPATMVNNLGYSPNLFTDNGTKIKYSTDLETLPNVELQEIAVEVRPFWGDSTNFEIGITRQDFKIRALLTTSFVVFGSAFTDNQRGTWGQNDINSGDDYEEMWRINNDANLNLGISVKRIGTIATDIYYIPATINDDDIDSGNFDTENDVIQLTDGEFVKFIDAGEFVYLINTNRRKVITNEFGDEVEVDPTNSSGVFTEFRGMFYCSYGGDGQLPTPSYSEISGGKFDDHTFFGIRWKMKIPQYHPDDITDDITNPDKFNSELFNPLTAIYGATANSNLKSHGKETSITKEGYNDMWRKMNFKFVASKYYSIAKHHALSFNSGGGYFYDNINQGTDQFWNTGTITVTGGGDADDSNPDYGLQRNTTMTGGAFAGQWLNFCLYFPQHTFYYSDDKESKSNDNPVSRPDGDDNTMYLGNTIRLISKTTNTSTYLRNDFHKTMFVEVPKEDIINILDKTIKGTTTKGFRNNQSPYTSDPLIGNYMYRNRTNTTPQITILNTNTSYFYKGHDTADCILYLNSLGLI